jgi:hypothetical protein
MSRFLALCFDQSAVYRRDLGEVIVRRAGIPLRRKPRRQESTLYLHLFVDSDIHLPVFPPFYGVSPLGFMDDNFNLRLGRRMTVWSVIS